MDDTQDIVPGFRLGTPQPRSRALDLLLLEARRMLGSEGMPKRLSPTTRKNAGRKNANRHARGNRHRREAANTTAAAASLAEMESDSNASVPTSDRSSSASLPASPLTRVDNETTTAAATESSPPPSLEAPQHGEQQANDPRRRHDSHPVSPSLALHVAAVAEHSQNGPAPQASADKSNGEQQKPPLAEPPTRPCPTEREREGQSPSPMTHAGAAPATSSQGMSNDGAGVKKAMGEKGMHSSTDPASSAHPRPSCVLGPLQPLAPQSSQQQQAHTEPKRRPALISASDSTEHANQHSANPPITTQEGREKEAALQASRDDPTYTLGRRPSSRSTR
nr:submandibular gland secretory Glx-rich protein CB-like [Dermacentor andersoni]